MAGVIGAAQDSAKRGRVGRRRWGLGPPALAPPGWGPRFVDYLYLSFTNATAFSPTDVLPLARWAKLTMMLQAAVSLATTALVIARAIGLFH